MFKRSNLGQVVQLLIDTLINLDTEGKRNRECSAFIKIKLSRVCTLFMNEH